MTTPLPSYTHGVWDAPMLGDTIGDNFDRTVAAHADRDALVDRPVGAAVDVRGAEPATSTPWRWGC